MRALLVMVHGSPRAESNDDVRRVVDDLRKRAAFDRVEVGFLDCNEPDIPTAIATCVSGGAKTIIAVPYFLHTGKHLLRDLPDILERERERHRDVEIVMGPALGQSELLGAIIAERVSAVH